MIVMEDSQGLSGLVPNLSLEDHIYQVRIMIINYSHCKNQQMSLEVYDVKCAMYHVPG